MARIFGGNANVKLDDTQMGDWLNSATINFDVGVGDITAFTDVCHNVVAGKKNTTLELAGMLDTATSAADEVIFECIGAGAKTCYFRPGGGVSGANNPHYISTAAGMNGAFIGKYSISLPVGDSAKFTSSIQFSGLTTRGTAPL